jgi:RNA polymerase sigma factor (sigma-70 family)
MLVRRVASSRLSGKMPQRIDPEDVVQSAYRSFFANARAERYESQRGGDLWQLLVTITLHKLNDQMKNSRRAKRAMNREHHFGSEDSLLGIQPQVLSQEPSPVAAVALVDAVEHIMRRLEPPQRRILELRLQGCNLAEIAAEVGRSESTVARVLDRVKRLLEQLQAE